MIALAQVDLEMLAEALEYHSDWESVWMFDPTTGETNLYDMGWEDQDEPDEDSPPEGAIMVDPSDPYEGYRDMELFIEGVGNDRARDLLSRAIDGRGAFRRFKDTVAEFPVIEAEWFSFRGRAIRGRAIQWLMRKGVVNQDEAEKALDAL